MKKTIICLMVLVVFCYFIYAQSYSAGPDVYTCKSGRVATLVASRDLTPIEVALTDGQFFSTSGQYYYLGLKTTDIVDTYSAYYNCHAYAWYITEKSFSVVPYWIDAGSGASNISTYWSGSYACFEPCYESEAIKIHYWHGDHSAVKSSVTGKYESKFGAWYVMRHNPNQIPYQWPGDRDYYKRTSNISGSNIIYYSGTSFTLNNPPSGSITWDLSPSSPFSLSPTSGSSTIVTKTASYGSGELLARVNGLVEAQKTITIKYPDISGPSKVNPLDYDIRYTIPGGGGSYSWSCSGDIQFGWSAGNTISVNAPNYEGYGMIYCTVTLNGISEQFSRGVVIVEP